LIFASLPGAGKRPSGCSIMDEALNPIEEALARIEVGIRQLKIQQDMFLSGHLPRQPFEARKEIETLIESLKRVHFQRFADRFRYNMLTSKYQTMCELYGKMLRAREEGRTRPGVPGFVTPRRTPEVTPPPALASAARRRGAAPSPPQGSFVIGDHTEDRVTRMFYDRFVQASKEASSGTKVVPYETFRSQIRSKTDAVRQKSGCSAVSYEVEVREGRVVLKSKPAETAAKTQAAVAQKAETANAKKRKS